VTDYLDGDCELLALAIHHLTGWPVVATWGEDPDVDFHALVLLPGGECLDWQGLHSPAELGELHPYPGPVAPPAVSSWCRPPVLADAVELVHRFDVQVTASDRNHPQPAQTLPAPDRRADAAPDVR
jgi:hypothetical protein